jgi:hypothetical protein
VARHQAAPKHCLMTSVAGVVGVVEGLHGVRCDGGGPS